MKTIQRMGLSKGLLIAASFALATTSFAGQWLTDLAQAKEKAKAENKQILLDFTGSDWCGWCMKLKAEVFDRQEFKSYAKKNLILVELDFPRGKALSKGLQEQNEQLKREYGVRGFPTIVVLNPDGTKAGQIGGYVAGGPKAYIAALKEKAPAPAPAEK